MDDLLKIDNDPSLPISRLKVVEAQIIVTLSNSTHTDFEVSTTRDVCVGIELICVHGAAHDNIGEYTSLEAQFQISQLHSIK